MLAELEFNGIRLDVPLLKRIERGDGGATGRRREGDLSPGRPAEFNIASPKQLREMLFDEMKLPTQRKTGITGEASTDQETLERLAALGHRAATKDRRASADRQAQGHLCRCACRHW